MLNEDQIKGKWNEIKGGLRNVWGRISDDELEQTKGNFTKVSGLIQSKYGETREVVKNKLDKLMASFDNETDKHPDDIGNTSFQRNPTAEPGVDNEYESNFTVGKNREDFDADRNARH
ncbi:MAG TPA: CsbD family protein [Bacteriovoracaceae bacterium]|nr:CsbD family protein [Bacteriovoracaceae bacterium]